MKKLLLVAALAISVVSLATADLTHTALKIGDDIELSGPGGGAEGACEIRYYNSCAGWIWIWSGWAAGDMVGTIFDLPADCGTYEGGGCEFTAPVVLIRTTAPDYGFTVDFETYNLDVDLCLDGAPIAGLYDVDFPASDPVTGWAGLFDLGNFGLVPDVFAFTMSWDAGVYPTIVTEDPNSNYHAPLYCPGYVMGPRMSYSFATAGVPDCPPVLWNDGVYDVNWYVRGNFYCPSVATEDASWGEVKNLFR